MKKKLISSAITTNKPGIYLTYFFLQKKEEDEEYKFTSKNY